MIKRIKWRRLLQKILPYGQLVKGYVIKAIRKIIQDSHHGMVEEIRNDPRKMWSSGGSRPGLPGLEHWSDVLPLGVTYATQTQYGELIVS